MFAKLRAPLSKTGRVIQSLNNSKLHSRVPLNTIAVRSFSAGVPEQPNSNESIISNLTDLAVDSSVVENIEKTFSFVKHADVNHISNAIMNVIDYIHVLGDVPYWGAIALTTLAIRVVLFPVALKTVQGAARMAAMRPEMNKLQEAMKNDPNIDQMHVKLRYQQDMKAIFAQYKVNPLRAMLWPFTQFPIFIGTFLALREMGNIYPDFATGGAFWFTDLAAADPYYILPVFNAASFLVMIELGSDGMSMEASQKGTFKMAMRALGVAMVPLTASLPAGVFMYWAVNNVFSITQSAALKNPALMKFFDIPKPPVSAPALKMVNPFSNIKEALEKEKSQGLDAKAEFLEGPTVPKPQGVAPVAPVLPPKTFTNNPTKTSKKN